LNCARANQIKPRKILKSGNRRGNKVASKTILLVAKNIGEYSKLTQNLQYFGYNILECQSGRQALERANATHPDFILAELDISDMDGIELCWMVRETSQVPLVPFVLLADSVAGEIQINGLRSGVDAFVLKTAPIREIITHVEALFKRFEQFQSQANPPAKSLSGTSPDFSILEILQVLNMSKKSGTLKIVGEDRLGRAGLLDGNLTWAETGLYEGEEALAEMIQWEPVQFEFEKDLIFTKLNIRRPTMEVILNCTTVLDENQNAQAKAAEPAPK
jgi:CheY-like chemotaxis protein